MEYGYAINISIGRAVGKNGAEWRIASLTPEPGGRKRVFLREVGADMHSAAWSVFGRLSVIFYAVAFVAVIAIRFWLKQRKKAERYMPASESFGEKVIVGLGGPRAAREFSENRK